MPPSNDQGPEHQEASVEVLPYDDSWPAMFASEKELLAQVQSPWLAGEIEHVGSTAIPGMPAKPVIDIMAPIRSIERTTCTWFRWQAYFGESDQFSGCASRGSCACARVR
jgi:GrpB-like predicted nucleotidyltransferase (UPF0157 family)